MIGRDIKKCYIGIIACSLLSIVIYIWSFFSVSRNNFLFNCDWIYYIFKYFYLAVFCTLGSFLYENGISKKYFGIVTIVALIIYCATINKFFNYNYLYAVQEICHSLWPIFTCFLSSKIIKMNQKKSKPQYVLGMGIYFVLLTAAIILIENTLVFSEFYRRDPAEMIFMIIIGIASWIIIEKQYCIKKNTLVLGIFSAIYFLVTFWNHERISNIVHSLTNSITSVYTDDLQADNWIGYRINLAWNAWFGDISSFLDDKFYSNVDNCPLFWIKYQKGWLPFTIVFFAGLLLLYFVVKLTKDSGIRKNSSVQVILLSIFFRCTLGYLAELFLIISTDMGALLLRNPAEILLLWILFGFTLGDNKCEVESNRKRIIENKKTRRTDA